MQEAPPIMAGLSLEGHLCEMLFRPTLKRGKTRQQGAYRVFPKNHQGRGTINYKTPSARLEKRVSGRKERIIARLRGHCRTGLIEKLFCFAPPSWDHS